MSDLTNLFAERKKASPSTNKRLFGDDSLGKRYSKARSNQPQKSIRKHHNNSKTNGARFTSKDFAKRHLEKDDIKREIKHYNQQILLTYIRKNFFAMSVVILFNILFTSSQQIVILSNMMLCITFVRLQLGKDILSDFYFLASRETIKIIIYSLNFYLIFNEMHSEKIERKDAQIIIILLNGCLNYLILVFCRPFFSIEGINNKKPYESGLQHLTNTLRKIVRSFIMMYNLRKPIIFLNLSYWLLVLCYIMYEQSQILLNNLISLQSVSSIFLTVLILHTFLQIIERIDEIFIIELFTPNKKTLSMALLRLDCSNKSNESITREVMKYIWRNGQIIWDVELLVHNYVINYDIINEFLNLELQRTIQSLLKYTLILSNLSIQKKINISRSLSLTSSIKEVQIIHEIVFLLQNKEYLFYIIQHILYFQLYSDDFPINTQGLHRKLQKVQQLILQISQKTGTNDLKKGINTFYLYLHSIILSYQ